MNRSTSFHRPWRAVSAAAGLLAVALGAAAADDSRVDVVGQMPLSAACPTASAELADALVDAWDDAPKPSSVAVTFKLQRHAVYDVAPQSDSARTVHQIRRAVHELRCDGGGDSERSVRFVVRFVDGDGDGRVAMVSDEPGR